MQEHDVVGIGNAIVDIIGRCDDAFLAQHGRSKGAMQLVEADTVAKLYEAMGPGVEISGGSVANTMAGIASFGGKAGFIGKVAQDQFGTVFAHDIRSAGVTFTTPAAAAGSDPTACSLILVTPDGQRTMNTFLGVSPQLGGGEIDAELIGSARIVYLEGYLFDRPEAKAAFRQAAAIASKAGRQVALSLSDAFCVDRHRAEFIGLIRDSVDILFANEAEITSLYQTNVVRGGRTARADATPSSRPSPAPRRAASSWAKAGASPSTRRRSPRSSTPPAPAISTRPASCWGWRAGSIWRLPDGSAAWRRPRSSATSVPGRRCRCTSWRRSRGC